jgi:hypothetical protein
VQQRMPGAPTAPRIRRRTILLPRFFSSCPDGTTVLVGEWLKRIPGFEPAAGRRQSPGGGVALLADPRRRPSRSSTRDHTEPIHLVNQRRRMWIMAGPNRKMVARVHSTDTHKLSASSPNLKYAAAQRDTNTTGSTGKPPYSNPPYSTGLGRLGISAAAPRLARPS